LNVQFCSLTRHSTHFVVRPASCRRVPSRICHAIGPMQRLDQPGIPFVLDSAINIDRGHPEVAAMCQPKNILVSRNGYSPSPPRAVSRPALIIREMSKASLLSHVGVSKACFCLGYKCDECEQWNQTCSAPIARSATLTAACANSITASF
jgi:hypothetical protein